jgi:hypothetical protein
MNKTACKHIYFLKIKKYFLPLYALFTNSGRRICAICFAKIEEYLREINASPLDKRAL